MLRADAVALFRRRGGAQPFAVLVTFRGSHQLAAVDAFLIHVPVFHPVPVLRAILILGKDRRGHAQQGRG